ncbi:MAG: alpha/beta hydrolase [Thermosynechococcaceae cyanobacterium]
MKYADIKQSCQWIGSVGAIVVSTAAASVSAAEQIYVQYSFLELSIPVTELETYAKNGQLSETLQTYAEYLKPEQLQQLRAALSTKLTLPPRTLSSLLSSPVGEALLARASTIIQSKSQGASPDALNTALVAAASDPEGLTLISLMRHFPDAGIQVDVTEGVALFQSVEQLVQQTQAAVALIQKQALATPPTGAADSAVLQSLQKPGPFRSDTLTIQLQDNTPKRLQIAGKARQFPADLYIPRRSDQAPIIVISHGFSADRSAYASFAKHLASYGFVVAVPEHPGSSAKQTQAWLAGEIDQPSQALEFIDRPLDVSYLLDDLTRRSKTDPQLKGRLNLNQVGVMGHSFGGYTALAVGGGKINFAALRQACGPEVKMTLNISQILQCQVLKLPQKEYVLSDPRIKAVLAVSPVTRSVFGKEGLGQIQAPVMFISSSMDTVTPSLLEQVQPFTWLPESRKYLVMIQSASHYSTSDKQRANQTLWEFPDSLVGPTPAVARSYLKALGTSFFQTELLQQSPATLSSSAVQQLSQPTLPLSLVRQLSMQNLKPVLKPVLSSKTAP